MARGIFGEIVDVFIDRAKSGKDTNRPELQRLLRSIREGKISLVMAGELSRISRSMRDFAEIWEMMKAYNCGFQSLRESFDTTTAAGEMVLYTMANLAQFERRQISERVAANMNARASRGLFNGGSIPVGYILLEEKPGVLVVDQEQAKLVKACFKAFLQEESLSRAARWLNEKNYRLPKRVWGGGLKQRLDYFTVDNLHQILQNKTYVGLRNYREKGELKETKAQWESIIDEVTFRRVQEKKLAINKSAKKPMSESRYPYLLTGLVRCMKCGDSLVGKSAHGRNGKFGYYEHGWATKRQSCLTEKIFRCEPRRISANKLEAFMIEKVHELMSSSDFARKLVIEANQAHAENSAKKQIERLKSLVYGYNSQLEAMAERLAQLPKTVSAKPIFHQMEKVENLKAETEEQIKILHSQNDYMGELPANLLDYEQFIKHLRSLFFEFQDKEIQAKIIQRLIKRIEVSETAAKIHFIVDASEITSETELRSNVVAFKEKETPPATNPGGGLQAASGFDFDFRSGSNSLTFGAGGGT